MFLTHLGINLRRGGNIYYFSDSLLRKTMRFCTVPVSFDMPPSDHRARALKTEEKASIPAGFLSLEIQAWLGELGVSLNPI